MNAQKLQHLERRGRYLRSQQFRSVVIIIASRIRYGLRALHAFSPTDSARKLAAALSH